MNEELNYLGPASVPYVAKEEVTTGQIKDERDLSTLEKTRQLCLNRIGYYQSVESIEFGKDLTIENQMLVNKKVLFHLQEFNILLDKAIKEVKERNNE